MQKNAAHGQTKNGKDCYHLTRLLLLKKLHPRFIPKMDSLCRKFAMLFRQQRKSKGSSTSWVPPPYVGDKCRVTVAAPYSFPLFLLLRGNAPPFRPEKKVPTHLLFLPGKHINPPKGKRQKNRNNTTTKKTGVSKFFLSRGTPIFDVVSQTTWRICKLEINWFLRLAFYFYCSQCEYIFLVIAWPQLNVDGWWKVVH